MMLVSIKIDHFPCAEAKGWRVELMEKYFQVSYEAIFHGYEASSHSTSECIRNGPMYDGCKVRQNMCIRVIVPWGTFRLLESITVV